MVGVLTEVNEQGVTITVNGSPSERKASLEFGSIAEARRAVTF
jgi:hypothetical protein